MNGIPCVRDSSSYVKPFVPLKEPGTKLALGTQLAFGNISAEMIIEWMEAYRSLGVDKVVTFYHKSLNVNALRVLKYYHESEFLDLYYFVPAAEGENRIVYSMVCVGNGIYTMEPTQNIV